MNYLDLVQRLIQESGTVSGSAQPSSVVSQTGRLAKAVNWVPAAWVDIQNMRPDWKWMQGEFTGALLMATARYTGASFSLTRWRAWNTQRDSLSIYDSAIGVSDEQPLNLMSWQAWRQIYDRGTQTDGRPIDYAVSPSGQLCFGPKPLISTYVVKGEYSKNPQALVDNEDIPEFAEHYHMLIVWQALLTLDEHDEANVSKAQRRRQDIMRVLETRELPEILIGGGPLA